MIFIKELMDSPAFFSHEEISIDLLKPAPYLYVPPTNDDAFHKLVEQSSDTYSSAGDILVRAYKDYYEVLFGYEYILAFKKAVTSNKVFVIRYHLTDSEAFKISTELSSLHYNLNIIDLAESYRIAMDVYQWRNIDLANYLGVGRSTITNRLLLLNLSSELKSSVKSSILTLECAKILSRLSHKDQLKWSRLAIKSNWGSRDLYRRVNPDWKPKHSMLSTENVVIQDSETKRLEEYLSDEISAPIKLNIDSTKKYKGSISISFSNLKELAGLLERIERKAQMGMFWKGEITIPVQGLDHMDKLLDGFIEKEDY